MRIGTLHNAVEPALHAAFTARDVEITALEDLAQSLTGAQETASQPPAKSGWRPFQRTPKAPLTSARTEETPLETAALAGISHLHLPLNAASSELVLSAQQNGLPCSISFNAAHTKFSETTAASDVQDLLPLAQFVTVQSHRQKALLLRRFGPMGTTPIHVLPAALDRAPLAEFNPWDGTPTLMAIETDGADLWATRQICTALQDAPDLPKGTAMTMICPDKFSAGFEHLTKNVPCTVRRIDPRDHAKLHQALSQSCALLAPALAYPPVNFILTAMALGRPVIASAIGDAPELIDPTCGWLVRPACPEDLHFAVLDALSPDQRKWEAMSQEALRRIRQVHSAGDICDTLLRLINSKT